MKMDKFEGRTKTDMFCHNCSKDFIAIIDFDINGNHEVKCPFCNHSHYRTVKDGYVTGERWDSGPIVDVPRTSKGQWENGQLSTIMPSNFLREKWLNR